MTVRRWCKFFGLGAVLLSCTSAPVHVDDRCPSSALTCATKDVYDPLGPDRQQIEIVRQILRAQSERIPTEMLLPNWPSELRRDMPVTPERVKWIVGQILTPDSQLMSQLKGILDQLKVGSPQFWDVYFRLYDRVVPFADGYAEIPGIILPFLKGKKKGVEYGAGTTNIMSLLLAQEPTLQMNGFDWSRQGIEIGNEKLKELIGELRKQGTRGVEMPKLKIEDLRTHRPRRKSYEFAIICNFLYTLGDILPAKDGRLKFLQKVSQELKPGGIVAVIDPMSFIQEDRQANHDYLVSVGTSVVENKAPATELDFALIGAMNIQFLVQGRHLFLPREVPQPDGRPMKGGLQEMGVKAGFEVVASGVTYNGAAQYVIFRRPMPKKSY